MTPRHDIEIYCMQTQSIKQYSLTVAALTTADMESGIDESTAGEVAAAAALASTSASPGCALSRV